MSAVQIQIGQLSNFVGQHMWNAHAANVRLGHVQPTVALDVDGTPRCVVVDLGHSLGQLSVDSGAVVSAGHNRKLLQDTRKQAADAWSGAVQLVGDGGDDGDDESDIDPPVFEYAHRAANWATDADELLDTPFWSDFALVRYQSRSLHQLHEHQLANLHEFGGFATGERVWSRDAEADELDNRLRVLFESCDRVDAITMLCDIDDSFGGVAAQMVARVRDEVPKSWLIAFALLNKDGAHTTVTPTVAGVRALSLNALQQHVSLFTLVSPLAAQSAFAPRRSNMYRTSAVLATPIQAFLDGPRRVGALHDLASVGKLLSHSRNAFALRASLPFVERELQLTPTRAADAVWSYAPNSPVYAASFASHALPVDVAARPATLHERFEAAWVLPRSHPSHKCARIAATCARVEAGAPEYLGGTLAALLDDAGRRNRQQRRLASLVNGVDDDDLAGAIADIENAFDVSE